MKSFAKEFLNEDIEGVPNAPHVYVAAFGKHPAWNDHMDDIGLVTESLVEAKRSLYVQGISSQIDGHTWERLGGKALPGFDHIFVWHRPNETMLGLIWSSRDGKGRQLYPMVVCVHVITQSLDWIWSEVLPRLESTAETCRKAGTQKEVVVALNMLQEALRRRSAKGPSRKSDATTRASETGVREWAAHFARDQVALRRICHHLSGTANGQAIGAAAAPSQTIRLPIVLGSPPPKSLNAWLRFLLAQVDPFWPVLLMMPRSGDWLDAVVGEPAKESYFRLRATPAAEPVVSAIPYAFSEQPESSIGQLLSDVSAGRMAQASFLNGTPASDALAAASSRLRGARRQSPKDFFSRLLKGG